MVLITVLRKIKILDPKFWNIQDSLDVGVAEVSPGKTTS